MIRKLKCKLDLHEWQIYYNIMRTSDYYMYEWNCRHCKHCEKFEIKYYDFMYHKVDIHASPLYYSWFENKLLHNDVIATLKKKCPLE